METPVYLFTGFLESGKTLFIQDTLEDKRFNSGEKTLLLVCEEGEEEYDPSKFSGKNVKIEVLDSQEELNEENLKKLAAACRAERVMVEYNGMWTLDTLYNNMPREWVVAQEFLFVDSRTFLNYNNNMRQQMVDKLQSCELAVFNRFPSGDDELKLQAHKIVRAINRRCDIAFETPDGKITYDDIELPLPYDLTAPVAEIADADYALFLQDIMDQTEKYRDKVNIVNRAIPGCLISCRLWFNTDSRIDVMRILINETISCPVFAVIGKRHRLQPVNDFTHFRHVLNVMLQCSG